MQKQSKKKTLKTPVKPDKAVPERTCLGCRKVRKATELLRLACTPSGEIFVDRTRRAPGRGAYLCWDAQCLQKALKSSKLVATWEQQATVPEFPVLWQQGEQLLLERLYSYLNLAQKAGVLVSGYYAICKARHQGEVRCLILTQDIAPSRATELRIWCEQQDIPCMIFSSKEELGKRLGKLSRSAVGMLDPHFCELFAGIYMALEKWRASQSYFLKKQASSYKR